MISRLLFPVLLLMFLAAACSRAAPIQNTPSLGVMLTASPRQTTSQPLATFPSVNGSNSKPAPTATSSPTLKPTPTRTLTITPTPRFPVFNPQEELNIQYLTKNPSAFHNLIAFTNQKAFAFTLVKKNNVSGDEFPWEIPSSWHITNWGDGQYRYLWMFSPDGQKAGLIGKSGYESAVFIPLDQSKKPKILMNGFTLENPAFQPVEIPAECQPPDGSETFLPCDYVRFSPDGRFLAFRYGEDICGRRMAVFDINKRENILNLKDRSVHYFRFLQDGKLWVASGHCEGGGITIFNLDEGISQLLGAEGEEFPSPDGKTILVENSDYAGPGARIWTYNLETGQVFTPYPQDMPTNVNSPIWTPDGQHFLFNYRTYTDISYPNFELSTPSQIILADAWTGVYQLLATSSNDDFHICSRPNRNCSYWYGDWVHIIHTPFSPSIVTFNNIGDTYACWGWGFNCSEPGQDFALNWKTGQIIPWEEAGLPVGTPTPTPQPTSAPDLTTHPIFTSEGGDYAFYTGLDGHSLWMVPQEGQPVIWVMNGSDFFYIP